MEGDHQGRACGIDVVWGRPFWAPCSPIEGDHKGRPCGIDMA
jgi:hypothetical protein